MMARTKTIAAIAYIGLAALVSPAAAHEFKVQSVVPIDGKVDCVEHRKSGDTVTTGPCKGFTPPPKVAIGEKFITDGKSRQIGVILANEMDTDVPAFGIQKGEWICVAAETAEDIPVDQSRDRTWLTIRKCKPDLAGNAPPPPQE